MDDLAKLANLPWETLLTLAGGYAAYYVANIGVRDHHKTVDVAFSTLVFGFFTAFAYELAKRSSLNILGCSIIAFAAAVLLGAVWTMVGRGYFLRILRAGRISNNDDLPSAWFVLFSGANLLVTQLTIKLKDGTWLKCDNLGKFNRMPNGPCVLGVAGDVLMYVTHYQLPDQDEFVEASTVTDPNWGDEITYLPKEEIVRIDLRRKMR